MKFLKWLIVVAMTAASAAAAVYAVLHRTELCFEVLDVASEKAKGFFASCKNWFLSEEDFFGTENTEAENEN